MSYDPEEHLAEACDIANGQYEDSGNSKRLYYVAVDEWKYLVAYDEGFEPSMAELIQDRLGAQPVYTYGAGPWILSNSPLEDDVIDNILSGKLPDSRL